MYNFSRAIVIKYNMNNGRYVCPNNCGRTYKFKSGMTQHLSYECGIEPKFKCHVCSKKFAQKSRMKSHINTIYNMLPLL